MSVGRDEKWRFIKVDKPKKRYWTIEWICIMIAGAIIHWKIPEYDDIVGIVVVIWLLDLFFEVILPSEIDKRIDMRMSNKDTKS